MNFLTQAAREIIEDMGWNEASVLCHVSDFLRMRKLERDFEDYLAEMADEECGQGADE
jgi:hypothetical protein